MQKRGHTEKMVVAGSRGVANVFDTSHDIIRDNIASLFKKTIHDISTNSALYGMYQPVEYIDQTGKEQTEYFMTKDGFLLVMMKLTGNGKLENVNLFWVLEYLAAFNKLQEKLIKEKYLDEYRAESPDTCNLVIDILENESRKGAKRLELALAYYADYIPEHTKEIYSARKALKAKAN